MSIRARIIHGSHLDELNPYGLTAEDLASARRAIAQWQERALRATQPTPAARAATNTVAERQRELDRMQARWAAPAPHATQWRRTVTAGQRELQRLLESWS